jgi:hypothetical protein
LRRLVRPYILRRLKTDRKIIADLPDKTEMIAFCSLTRRQAILYQQSVEELAERLDAPEVEGIQRRGIILAFLTRFKQICNHPSQWLGEAAYEPRDSGKFERLRELCEPIAARQERVLVFTQYREMTGPLAEPPGRPVRTPGVGPRRPDACRQTEATGRHLPARGRPTVFRPVPQGRRHRAEPDGRLACDSLRPLVESGGRKPGHRPRVSHRPKRNVVVHKFTCRGTVEERIHAAHRRQKRRLAEDILGEGAERLLTEMNNAELLRFVSLDMASASADERPE